MKSADLNFTEKELLSLYSSRVEEVSKHLEDKSGFDKEEVVAILFRCAEHLQAQNYRQNLETKGLRMYRLVQSKSTGYYFSFENDGTYVFSNSTKKAKKFYSEDDAISCFEIIERSIPLDKFQIVCILPKVKK